MAFARSHDLVLLYVAVMVTLIVFLLLTGVEWKP
jgi:hypothetical protein